MTERVKYNDLVFVRLQHRFEIDRTTGGSEIEDRMVVTIAHRPRINFYDDDTTQVSDTHTACGADFTYLTARAVVDRRILNMRNLRQCLHQACFGRGR